MTTETLDKYTWFVTLIREKGCSCYSGSGENYTRHEISQVIIKCNNEKDAIQKSLEFINLKRPRESITTEPINTSEDWTILFNDSLSKFSIIKCDFPIEESMEFCYSDLNQFD